jgi:predicted TIM-barrel fold metal-dependent hydrolase
LIGPRIARPLEPIALDLDARREHLRRAGISWQLLSLSSLWNIDNLPTAQSLPLIQAFNDATVQAVAEMRDTFGGLAALPLQDLDAASAELLRVHAAGIRGAILPAGAFATLAQAIELAPLLRQANLLGAHLFVHPGELHPAQGRDSQDEDNWWPRRIVLQTQHQLSAAMLTLVSTPLLREFPHITVQVANLGGGLPFYLERLHAVAEDNPAGREDVWRYDCRQVIVDSASFGPLAVGMAIDALGVEKVVAGTDMPLFAASRAVESFRSARERRVPAIDGAPES